MRNYYLPRFDMNNDGGVDMTDIAIFAPARKFLGIIYETLKNNWIFEDFPNFVLASSCVKNNKNWSRLLS
jgi:hypothetical protein